MMLFQTYWRKVYERLVKITPGIGNNAEAVEAERRSEGMLAEAASMNSAIMTDVEYLSDVQQRNHFRDRVAEALTMRRQTS